MNRLEVELMYVQFFVIYDVMRGLMTKHIFKVNVSLNLFLCAMGRVDVVEFVQDCQLHAYNNTAQYGFES